MRVGRYKITLTVHINDRKVHASPIFKEKVIAWMKLLSAKHKYIGIGLENIFFVGNLQTEVFGYVWSLKFLTKSCL